MIKFLLSILAVLAAGIAIFLLTLRLNSGQEIPTGVAGKPAEELAGRIETAIGAAKWNRIGRISFSDPASGSRHTIDLKRDLHEIEWNRDGVLYRLIRSGDETTAFRNGVKQEPDETDAIAEVAATFFPITPFWLNPFADLSRQKIEKIGERALLVRYPDYRGVHLVVTDRNYRPLHWKSWNDNLPVAGMETSFENWKRLENGAWISLVRKNQFQEFRITDISIEESGSPDEKKNRFAGF